MVHADLASLESTAGLSPSRDRRHNDRQNSHSRVYRGQGAVGGVTHRGGHRCRRQHAAVQCQGARNVEAQPEAETDDRQGEEEENDNWRTRGNITYWETSR